MALPTGTTLEQFAAVFRDATGAEIRSDLKAQYGIDIPASYSRDATVKRAFTMLTTPAVVENPPPPPSAPAGATFQVRSVGVPQRTRGGRTWSHAWSEVQESDLSPEQWAALRADRRIMIRSK